MSARETWLQRYLRGEATFESIDDEPSPRDNLEASRFPNATVPP